MSPPWAAVRGSSPTHTTRPGGQPIAGLLSSLPANKVKYNRTTARQVNYTPCGDLPMEGSLSSLSANYVRDQIRTSGGQPIADNLSFISANKKTYY